MISGPRSPRRTAIVTAVALGFALLVPALGYAYPGTLHAALFLVGYGAGFVLWLVVPSGMPWSVLRVPYRLTLLAFLLLHKVEEDRTQFFEVFSAKIPKTAPFEVCVAAP